MKNKDQIKLIDGTFSPEGAAAVLFAVLDDKIRFHNIRVLSIQERFGGDTSQSENRIAELKAAKAQVAQIIAEAKRSNVQIELFSNIDIRLKPVAEQGHTSATLVAEDN